MRIQNADKIGRQPARAGRVPTESRLCLNAGWSRVEEGGFGRGEDLVRSVSYMGSVHMQFILARTTWVGMMQG